MSYVDSLFVHSNDGGVEFTLVGGSVPGVSALPSPLESCAYVYNMYPSADHVIFASYVIFTTRLHHLFT